MSAAQIKQRFDLQQRRWTSCQSNSDGDCTWKDCPQIRDGEPDKSGRHCPLDKDLKPPLRSALKYAGGKSWLVPTLAKLYAPHRHRRLVEPFCGALNVALGLRPTSALLNDSNPHLMNFHRWIQQGGRPRMRFDNDERRYYLCRRKFNRLALHGGTQSDEAAELFYYLNKTGFNGLCRFNSDGGFNVPFGRCATINYVRDFSAWTEAMIGWKLMTGDFRDVPFTERGVEPDAWLYSDPPYDVPFTKYSGTAFSWDDQVHLAEWLTKHRGPVVASNQATARVLKLYRSLGFKVKTLLAPRKISCNGDRTPAREMLATRNI